MTGASANLSEVADRKDHDITVKLIGKFKGYGLAKLPWRRTLESIRELPVFRKPK